MFVSLSPTTKCQLACSFLEGSSYFEVIFLVFVNTGILSLGHRFTPYALGVACDCCVDVCILCVFSQSLTK